LIEKLNEIINGKYYVELSEQEADNCIELVKTFQILLINSELEIN
jgi:hypothetical protein